MKELSAYTGLPPYDATSRTKQLLKWVSYGMWLLVMMVALIYFSITDSSNPIAVLSTKLENPYKLPNVTVCLQLKQPMYDLQSTMSFTSPVDGYDYAPYATMRAFGGSAIFPTVGVSTCVEYAATTGFVAVKSTSAWLFTVNWFALTNNEDNHNASFYNSHDAGILGAIYFGNPSDGFTYYLPGVSYVGITLQKSYTIDGTGVISPIYDANVVPLVSNGFTDGCTPPENFTYCSVGVLQIKLAVHNFQVQITTLESTSLLAKRILTDTFSMFGIVGSVLAIFFGNIITRLIFTHQKTAFIDHSVREAILYVIKEEQEKARNRDSQKPTDNNSKNKLLEMGTMQ